MPRMRISVCLSAIRRASCPSPHPKSRTRNWGGISCDDESLRTAMRRWWTYRPCVDLMKFIYGAFQWKQGVVE
jgi:hypothetical protein